MAAIELGFDERGHVDPIHPHPDDQSRHVSVDEHGVDDLRVGEIDVAQRGARQVDAREPGATELVAVGHVLRHRDERRTVRLMHTDRIPNAVSRV